MPRQGADKTILALSPDLYPSRPVSLAGGGDIQQLRVPGAAFTSTESSVLSPDFSWIPKAICLLKLSSFPMRQDFPIFYLLNLAKDPFYLFVFG